MALDIEFPSPEDEIKRRYDLVNNAPPLSIEMPTSIENSIGLTDIQPFEKPLDIYPAKQKETKGFLESFGHTFKEVEVVANAIDFGYHKYKQHQVANDLASQNPLQSETPNNWTALEVNNFVGYPQQYWPFISDSSSPEELQARQQEVSRLVKEDEEYADGSTWGKILGGLTGVAVDIPLFGWIPIANSLRYSKYSKTIIGNMARQAPGVTASSLAYTAALDGATTGKTMQDFAIDATVNTLAGIALSGAAAGIGRSLRGGDMYNAKHALKMNFQDIEAVEVVKDGISVGMKARPVVGSAANAMEVTRAQEFLDSRLAKMGLFRVPVVGTGIEKTFKIFSPQFKAFTSDWGPTRAWINRNADHNFITEGIREGKAAPVNFESEMMRYHSESANLGQQLEGLRHEANGMTPGLGPINGAKRLAQRISQDTPQYTSETWGRDVMDTLFSGESSQVSQVNEAVTQLEEFYSRHLKEYQVANGLEERDLPVKTAIGYLSRRYNTRQMNTITGTESWDSMCMQYFREGDAMIEHAMHPVTELETEIEETKESIHNGVNAQANRATLKALEKQLKKARLELVDRISDDESLQNLLLENILSREDQQKLTKILEPWNKEIGVEKSLKSELSAIKRSLSGEKRKFETGKKTVGVKAGEIIPEKDYASIKERIKELEKQVKEKNAELEKVTNNVADIRAGLMEDVDSGAIKRSFYYRDEEGGQVKFKKPNTSPKFRPLYKIHGEFADAEMLKDAKAIHSNITGTNPDKLAQRMANTLDAKATGNPMAERSFLIPDQTLLANGFLSTDLQKNATLYALTLGRRTAKAKTLKGLGATKSGFAGYTEEMTKEFERRKETIRASNRTEAQKNKDSTKLKKSFDKELKFVSALDAVSMGTYSNTGHNQNIRDTSNAIRSLTAATRLGNLPILQLADFPVQIYREGVWRWARDGIFPMIKSMNGTIKAAGGERYRRQASEAGMALESVMHTKTNELWQNATESGSSLAGGVADAMEHLAKFANRASGSAFLEDTNQRLIAAISQSSLIDKMYRYENGTINKKELTQLLQFGIDPKKQSRILLDAFESSPGSFAKKTGGYESEYWDWENKEARNMMTDNIRKSIRSTLIRKGLFESPLMSNNNVISLLFTFTGWYFSALNRFLIPALQSPLDHHLVSGGVAVFGMSLLVDPMRAWTRGNSFDMDNEAWFASAIGDVPTFAPIYSAAMRGNAILDKDFLNKIKNDRYRNLNVLGGSGGAPIGLAENVARGLRMFSNGSWNQADIKRLANSLPAAQMWWMNNWKNQFVESLTDGLPRNYQSANK